MKVTAKSVFLSRAELRAILAFASTDETRVNLHAVLFDVAQRTLVATDGHRMATVTADAVAPGDADGEDPPVDAEKIVVPRSFLDSVVKGSTGKGRIVISWGADGALTATMQDRHDKPIGVTLTGKRSDQAFPPYRAVMPSQLDAGSHTGDFNARYLDDLALLASAGAVSLSVSLFAPTEHRAGSDSPGMAVVRGRSDDDRAEWRVCMMPVRISGHPRVADWERDRVPIGLPCRDPHEGRSKAANAA